MQTIDQKTPPDEEKMPPPNEQKIPSSEEMPLSSEQKSPPAESSPTLNSSSVLQDLLRDHSSEIGNWCEIVSNHQEQLATTTESFKSTTADLNIEHDGPFYIFVSNLNLQQQKRDYQQDVDSSMRDELYQFFEGRNNLFDVHFYPQPRGCCMLYARDFESCIRVLRKDGEEFKGRKIKVEYAATTDPPKYTRYTNVQLDAQLQTYKEKHPPPEKLKPKANPFGNAKPVDTRNILEKQKKKIEQEEQQQPSGKQQQQQPPERADKDHSQSEAPPIHSIPKLLIRNDKHRDDQPPRGGRNLLANCSNSNQQIRHPTQRDRDFRNRNQQDQQRQDQQREKRMVGQMPFGNAKSVDTRNTLEKQKNIGQEEQQQPNNGPNNNGQQRQQQQLPQPPERADKEHSQSETASIHSGSSKRRDDQPPRDRNGSNRSNSNQQMRQPHNRTIYPNRDRNRNQQDQRRYDQQRDKRFAGQMHQHLQSNTTNNEPQKSKSDNQREQEQSKQEESKQEPEQPVSVSTVDDQPAVHDNNDNNGGTEAKKNKKSSRDKKKKLAKEVPGTKNKFAALINLKEGSASED